MTLGLRHLPDIVVFLLAMGVHSTVFGKVFSPAEQKRRWVGLANRGSQLVLVLGLVWVVGDALFGMPQVGFKELLNWWALALIGAAILSFPFPRVAEQPERRAFLKTAARCAVAAPLIVTGAGSLSRKNFQVAEIPVTIPGLPADLQGLRIVQLTDIHLSPLLERADLRRVVAMANELRAHIVAVTGDLITARWDPLDDALAELAMLRSDAGTFACHGNHEIYARAEDYATVQGKRLGMRFLRHENAPLRFGSATLNLAGVDYQRKRMPYLENAEKLVEKGNVNVLLSHNPDVFPVARQKGFALTLSGHTHGGQVNVEILDHSVNLARFMTPFTKGLYQEDGASVYVSPGIGTVGIPVRLGAPPEISLVTLCAT